MFQHELRKLFRRISFSGLEPVHGDVEPGGEFAQRFDARCSGVRFEPADVRVRDALGCEVALAEAEFEPSLPDALTDRCHVRIEAAWTFSERARKSGLLPSMGSVGDCYDNAMMEAFWSRMQVELLDSRRWKTRVELANAIFEYIEVYKINTTTQAA
jgi:hypothetical protein